LLLVYLAVPAGCFSSLRLKEKSMRFHLAIQAVLVLVLGVAGIAAAQQPPDRGGQPDGRGRGGPGGFGMTGGGGFTSRMSLLNISEVKKELELADEQVTELEKVAEALRTKYGFGRGPGGPGGGPGGPGGGPGGRPRRGDNNNNNNNNGAGITAPAQWLFVAMQEPQAGQARGRGGFTPPTPEQMAEFEKQRVERAREERAELAKILLPHQIKRLNEIYVQQAGVNALQDEEIASELKISDAQKAKLAEVREANRAASQEQMRALFQGGGGGGGGDRDAMRAKFEEVRKAADAKLLAVLSTEQQKKFEELKGKPFTMPENAGRGGPGGPGGRTRGKGGNDNNNN
jgi:Spy/CpxP family protein refolding chaperone